MTSSPQYGTTWWGRRWLDALQAVDYENRIPRGLAYAAEGKVQSLKIDPEAHAVKARVAGNFDPFYAVKLTLPAIAEEDVSRLIDEMAESPLIVARLAARELAPEISEICERLGIKIFGASGVIVGKLLRDNPRIKGVGYSSDAYRVKSKRHLMEGTRG